MQKFESTLHLSNYYVLIQLILVVGSLASVAYLTVNGLIKCLLIFGVLGYGIWTIYRHFQWQVIGQDEDGWYLKSADKKIPIAVKEESTVTSLVSVLRFNLPEKRFTQSYVIFKDAMPMGNYRQFIVRMRFFKPEVLKKIHPYAKIPAFEPREG